MATRCPACGTVFRVVHDQLKVSEGWVRCGRCAEVFNAADGLFDLDAESSNDPAPARHVSAGLAPPSSPADELAHDSVAQLAAPEEALELPHDDAPAAPTAAEELAAAYELLPLDGADASDRLDTPDFVRRADAAARWRHPALRGALALCAVLLTASLAGQLALHYRDGLAANWPPARSALVRACAQLGCRIEAPRRIGSLSVESSSFTRIDGGALYQLTLVLRNRANTAVRMPAIDFALTDARGQTTARRVLHASELGQSAPALPPLAEMPLSATVDLGDRPVAGYTVDLFYP